LSQNQTPFLRRVRDVLYKEERNCTIFVEGKGGKGKSYVALKIAHELDPEFKASNLHERLAFTPEDFMNILINSPLKHGSVVIFDDVGVGLGARDWYNFVNKSIGYIMQTFRYRNLVTIFTHQKHREVDIQVRTRADFLIWCESKLKNLKLNKVKIYEVVDFPGGTSVNQFLRLKKGLAIQYFYLKLVDDPELLQRYEQLSLNWKSSLPLELKEKMEKEEEENKKKKKEIDVDVDGRLGKLVQALNEKRHILTCPMCGYTWKAHSLKLKPQCPSCRRSFKIEESLEAIEAQS
jgi:ssDNA-binding Zn-finger/Zn-ribbon topoisomerase 1